MTPDQTNWQHGFWRGILREEDGTPSFSRTGSLLLLIGVLGWVTHVVVKTHSIPDLTGPGYFFTGGTMSLYGVNKGTTAVKNVFDTIKNAANVMNNKPQA